MLLNFYSAIYFWKKPITYTIPGDKRMYGGKDKIYHVRQKILIFTLKVKVYLVFRNWFLYRLKD
ncbi:hypothetical protein QW060_05550 [Myroides ceti]|uniref:Uncharacterized protein n=1 Tax=Paenimyroides ceti TaxID=395087 RepID=A0ABT8CQ12_9FLAO|nr:hypothetical protein [Paenimyroides ceti]MDN3706593.1 hypothetical protein [Paenimyroides ceti]